MAGNKILKDGEKATLSVLAKVGIGIASVAIVGGGIFGIKTVIDSKKTIEASTENVIEQTLDAVNDSVEEYVNDAIDKADQQDSLKEQDEPDVLDEEDKSEDEYIDENSHEDKNDKKYSTAKKGNKSKATIKKTESEEVIDADALAAYENWLKILTLNNKKPSTAVNSSSSNNGGSSNNSENSNAAVNDNQAVNPNWEWPTHDDKKKAPDVIKQANAKAKDIVAYDFINNPSGYSNDAYSVLVNNMKNKAPKSQAKYTVMLYLCGADLESKNLSGSATSDIMTMIYGLSQMSKEERENVNILVLAGGSSEWAPDRLKENNQDRATIYYIDPSKLPLDKSATQKLYWMNDGSAGSQETNREIEALLRDCLVTLATYEPAANKTASFMGRSEVLSGFMNVASNLYPADNYGLILNNHGGGMLDGICYSDPLNDQDDVKSITAYKLEQAIRQSDIFVNSDPNKKALSMVVFDACLMGGIEMAINISPYSQYMVGSEEIEAGSLDYASMLESIAKDPADAKKIATTLSLSNQSLHLSSNDGTIIQSMLAFDLSKVDAYANNVEIFAKDALSALTSSDAVLSNATYKALKQARIHSLLLGGSDDRDGIYDYVDVYDFFNKYRSYLNDYIDGRIPSDLTSANKDSLRKITADIDKVLENIFDNKNGKSFIVDGYINYFGAGFEYGSANIAISDASSMKMYKLVNKASVIGAESDADLALAGVSIVMPYYNSEIKNGNLIKKYTDNDNYSNNLLPNYEKLALAFCQEYTSAVAGSDGARVSQLRENAAKVTELIDAPDGEDRRAKDFIELYQDIFVHDEHGNLAASEIIDVTHGNDQSVLTTDKFLHVKIADTYSDDVKTKQESYESTYAGGKIFSDSPFEDFADTVQKLVAYISRKHDYNGITSDLVYGSGIVSNSNISSGNESIDVQLAKIKDAVGYQIECALADANKYDWGFMGNIYSDADYNEVYSFSGVIYKTEDPTTPVAANLLFGDDGNGNLIFVKAMADSYVLASDCAYIEFDHFTVDNGQLTKVENSSIAGDLKMEVSGSNITVKKTQLSSSNEEISKNAYTLGVMAGKSTYESTAFLLDTVKVSDADYNSYESNIGTSTEYVPTGTDSGSTGKLAKAPSKEPEIEKLPDEKTVDVAVIAPEGSEDEGIVIDGVVDLSPIANKEGEEKVNAQENSANIAVIPVENTITDTIMMATMTPIEVPAEAQVGGVEATQSLDASQPMEGNQPTVEVSVAPSVETVPVIEVTPASTHVVEATPATETVAPSIQETPVTETPVEVVPVTPVEEVESAEAAPVAEEAPIVETTPSAESDV